ncbi:trypsin-like [Diabrotica virgifera virgifera]|uniref:Trypsin-like n=1 Tax=Diabrotica virgifera virgifera TaxID=50390 RepID=A0A6P7F838_DIAVI|nr:trypsin-like [Diabrotica virgifera virgifera]
MLTLELLLLSILFVSCVQPKLRIIGGEECKKSYPFMVSIRIRNIHYCAGTLIAPKWVLTAAHCVSKTNLQTAVIGSNYLVPKSDESFMDVSIIEYTIHPNFDEVNFVNDIAVMKLAEPVRFPSLVQLPNKSSSENIQIYDQESLVMGWGAVIEGSTTSSPVLRCVYLSLITIEECRLYYPQNLIETSQICSLSKNRDACQGDSGGPLLTHDVQYGIVSWGWGCGRYPGVYTKVYHFLHFIEEAIKNDANNKCINVVLFFLLVLSEFLNINIHNIFLGIK